MEWLFPITVWLAVRGPGVVFGAILQHRDRRPRPRNPRPTQSSIASFTRTLCIERTEGRLVAGAGETTATVRHRLGHAARAAGHKLSIRRAGDEVYFWVEGRRAGNGRRRRGKGASS